MDSIRKANDYSILEKLMQLINEKGYFGYSVIGEDLLWGDNEDNFNDVFLRHMAPDTNKVYFYDILKQAVMNGDLYPDKYASIVDYDCIKSGKWEQIYGSCSFAYIDGNYAFPLINAKKIDSLRAEIGIRNWKEHLDITGLKYDDKIRPWE
nr:hypothetical protein [uncultured Carboxylicivirga sp.]